MDATVSEEGQPRVFQVVDEARLVDFLQRLGSDRSAADLADALSAAGLAIVTREPSPGLLVSMALRNDHGLLAPGFIGSEDRQLGRQRAAISQMRQIHEEVVGTGFYAWQKEESYVGALIVAAGGKTEEPPRLPGDGL